MPWAHADWDSDQKYIDKTTVQLAQLKTAIRQYAAYEKKLRQYEKELPSVRGGFADPEQHVPTLAEETVRSVHSALRLRMERASAETSASYKKGAADIWRWKVELEGPSFAFTWALRRLRQLGLEAEATASAPMVLTGAKEGQPSRLTFTGRHIRLAAAPKAEKEKKLEIGTALKRRADPQAVKIRKLLKEEHALQLRLNGLRSVEHRVRRLQQYIEYLRKRPPASLHPANAIIPIAQLDLIRIERIEHRGSSIHLWAKAISASARDTALAWLRQQSKKGPPIRALRVPLLYRDAELALIPSAKTKGWGNRGELLLLQARPMDLALVSEPKVAVVVSGDEATLSGRVAKATMGQALDAAANGFSLNISFDKTDSTFLVSSRTSQPAKQKKKQRRGRKQKNAKDGIDIFAADIAVSDAFALLRGRTTRQLSVPAALGEAADRISLVGNAPLDTWLRLLGRGLGLRPKFQRRHLKLIPLRGSASLQRVYPARSISALGKRLVATATLSDLQIRLLWLAGKKSSAVVSGLNGTPRRVSIGTRLGSGQWQVVAISQRGITVRWQADGMQKDIILPAGKDNPQGGSGDTSKRAERQALTLSQ